MGRGIKIFSREQNAGAGGGEDNHGQVQHVSELEGFVLLGRGLILHAESRVRTYCPSNVSKIPSPLLSVEACAGSADLGVP